MLQKYIVETLGTQIHSLNTYLLRPLLYELCRKDGK